MEPKKAPLETSVEKKKTPAKRKPVIIQLSNEDVREVVGGLTDSRCPPSDY